MSVTPLGALPAYRSQATLLPMSGNESADTIPQVGSGKTRMFTPLLIGALLVAVGIGNIWVARGKTIYYESAYWQSTNQHPVKRSPKFLRELPTEVSEGDSLAARRAFSRVVFYGMVARCGYILMVIGFGMALLTALQITKERSGTNQNL